MVRLIHFLTVKRSLAGMLGIAIGFMIGITLLLTFASISVSALGGGPIAVNTTCILMMVFSLPLALLAIYSEWMDPQNSPGFAFFGLVFLGTLCGALAPLVLVSLFGSQSSVASAQTEKPGLETIPDFVLVKVSSDAVSSSSTPYASIPFSSFVAVCVAVIGGRLHTALGAAGRASAGKGGIN